MLIAHCPQCDQARAFVPELCGMPVICPGCSTQFTLQRPPMHFVNVLGGFLASAASLALLTYMGVLGGLVAFARHGMFLGVFLAVALMAGMRLGTVLYLFAVYLIGFSILARL